MFLHIGCGVDDLAFWGFAVKNAAWTTQLTSKWHCGLTPLELLTKTNDDHVDLLYSHIWGCPVFVLDQMLKDEKKY